MIARKKPAKPAKRKAAKPAKRKAAKPAKRAPRARKPEPAKTKSAFSAAVLSALGQGTPGAWASDHLAESQRMTGWHYVAIRANAKQCGAANIQVFEEDRAAKANHRKSRFKSHDQEVPEYLAPLGDESHLVRLLSKPHPECSGSTFLYDVAQQLDMTGSALIVKVRNRVGLPVEMYVLPTGAVQGMPATPEYPRGYWQVAYNLVGSLTTDPQGYTELRGYQALSGAIIKPEDMIVIRWPHPILRDDGYGAITAGSLWSDTATQVDQSRWSHMKNGINPSFAVTMEEDPGEDVAKDFYKTIDQRFSGPENAGRPFLAAGGKTVVPLGTTPKDMDYNQAFIQLRDAIMALHGVPGVAAGITDGGSYAAFYAALKQFITLVVQPTLTLIAGELREQLASEFEADGRRYVIWLTAAAIDDPEILERQLATDISAQSITKNEIRALRGQKPRPDGDVYVAAVPQGAAMPPAGMPDKAATGVPGVPTMGEDTELPAPGDAPEATADGKVADTALNGAQITAATGIVAQVANGMLPRDSGVAQIQVFFNLTTEQAEAIMGSAGQGFTPTPEDKAKPASEEPAAESVDPLTKSIGDGEPDFDAEDAAILAARDKEDADIEATRDKEAAAIEEARDAEDDEIRRKRLAAAEAGEPGDDAEYDREDAALDAERDRADAARVARYGREDAALVRTRQLEDESIERQRGEKEEPTVANKLAHAARGLLQKAWRAFP